jgi:hypothetical protein
MDGKHNGPLAVFCVKSGSKYPADYANRLHRGVARHLSLPHTFHCLTDDPVGLDPAIIPHPLPAPDPGTCWNKLHIFERDAAPAGTTILYLDLDVVVTGSLDELISWRHGDDFVGQPDWNRPFFPQFNSSVMRLVAGSHQEVAASFREANNDGRLRRRDEWDATTRGHDKVVYWRGWRRFGGDQEWITDALRPKRSVNSRAFPRGWIVSYKKHGRHGLPAAAKIVVFHGSPKPSEVRDDYVIEHWR